jgi:O-antigen/teichoic acid export membrane protein
MTRVSLLTRILGPQQYGVLALCTTYVVSIDRVISFQAWQAIVKFGKDLLTHNNKMHLRALIKLGLCLDISSAILGTVLGILISKPLTLFLGWDESIQPLLITGSCALAFTWEGTPTGVLRLFDRFDVLSYGNVVRAITSLFLVGGVLLTGQDLLGVMITYTLAKIITNLYLMFAALRTLRANQIHNFASAPIKDIHDYFPGLWNYVWTTNLNSMIRMLSRHIDIILLAGTVEPAKLGLYEVAKQVGQMTMSLAQPFYQSIYPELALLWAKDNRCSFIRLMKYSTIIVGSGAIVGWLLFVGGGKMFLALAFGNLFQAAYPVSIVYLFATVIALMTFTFQPAMLALGLPQRSFQAHLISTIVHMIVLVPAVRIFGIIGASFAYLLYYVVWSGKMLYTLRQVLGNSR